MTFEEKVERLRAFGAGVVEVQDYHEALFQPGRAPYRYATLKWENPPDVHQAAGELADLAVELEAYLTMITGHGVRFMLALARDLTDDEIAAARKVA